MNDEILVRVGNGRANLAEDLEALHDSELALPAVIIEPLAFDKFHDEIRQAIGCNRAAIESGDIRMIQGGENSFFLLELAQETGATENALNQLDRNRAAELQIIGQIN